MYFLLIQALILHLLSLHPVHTLSTTLLQMLVQTAPVGSNPSQVTAECSCSDILFAGVPSQRFSFLMHHISEDNGEQVLVGKISFSPSEVLGHGSAGTFVFRYRFYIF